MIRNNINPYYAYGFITMYCADCRDVLGNLEDESIQTVITSPPLSFTLDGQCFQAEEAPQDYTKFLIEILGWLKKPLKNNGVVFYELWDTEALIITQHIADVAVQDGWFLKDAIKCYNQNDLVKGTVLVFSKTQKPYWNNSLHFPQPWVVPHEPGLWLCNRCHSIYTEPQICTCGCVSFTDHLAVFSQELVRRCILLASPNKPKGFILDPFAGSGTTGLVAKQLRKPTILIEWAERYCQMAEVRFRNAQG